MADPIKELVHDHRELSGLLLAVHEALSRIERGQSTLEDEQHEIRDGIEAFRESLLEHFAREQEGLLPFVTTHLPASRDRVDQLIVEHDRIAALLGALVKDVGLVDAGGALSSFRRSLRSFDELYAAHTKSELAFLTEVVGSLAHDPAAAAKLQALLDEE